MSEETSVVGGTEEAPVAGAPAVSGEYLTRAEVSAMLEDQARAWQSWVDKSTGKLEKKLGELMGRNESAVEAARASGMTPSDVGKLKKALDKDALRQALGGADADKVGADKVGADKAGADKVGAGTAGPSTGSGGDPVDMAGMVLARVYGLESTDIEAGLVSLEGDEDTYLRSIVEAGKAKAARLERDNAFRRVRPAAVPGVGPEGAVSPRNPIEKVNSVGDLYKLGAAEVDALRRKRSR